MKQFEQFPHQCQGCCSNEAKWTKGLSRRPNQPSRLAVTANDTNAGLAQLVEHLICNQGVADSSSATGTIFQNAV